MIRRRLLLCAVSVLSVWFLHPGVLSARPPARNAVQIDLMLSTGDKVAGAILACTDTVLSVRVKKRRRKVVLANLVRFSLTFPAAEQVELAKLDGVARGLAEGKALLGRKLPGLAGIVFLRALAADPDVATDIQAAYKAAGKPAPPALNGKDDGKDEARPRRYIPPTPEQIEASLAMAGQWGLKMKKVAPATHLVESRFFRIYSAWPKRDDRALQRIYDRLYKALCKQFAIPAGENIWVGKLPVYACWTKAQYVKFLTEVCETSQQMATDSAGIAGSRALPGGKGAAFRFVVLGPVKPEGVSKSSAQKWFFELLVHESTHAFLGRYISTRHVPSWVSEGIAETMAANLVPGSQASRKIKDAHKALRSRQVDFTRLFSAEENIPLDGFHYGLAQSFVQYLLARDRKKFLRFVELLKEGGSDAEALKETYALTHETLVKAWKKAVSRRR